MDPLHRRLYIQWCQSPSIEISVGGDDDSSTPTSGGLDKFRIPRELLRRRSRFFREQLEGGWNVSSGSAADDISKRGSVIHLPNTSVQTAEDFFVWTLSPQPQIDVQHATFDDIVRLGVFAWTYRVPALSNQVTDLIRKSLADGVWRLQAKLVDDVYAATRASSEDESRGISPLRELIREALGQLPRSTVESEDHGDRESWKATFLKHAQLGWDYIDAGGKEWTREKFLEGRCRFHDHRDLPQRNEEVVMADDGECPFAREECFPSDEEQKRRDMLEKITGKEWKADTDVVVVENRAEKPVVTTVEGGGAVNGAFHQSPATAETEEKEMPSHEAAPAPDARITEHTSSTIVPEAPVENPTPNGIVDEKVDATTLPKAAAAPTTTQLNENSIASEAVDDEVNGGYTFESIIDKWSAPKAHAILSSQVGKESSNSLDTTSTSTMVMNGNGAVVDSESIPDAAEGASLASESASARDEAQKDGEKGGQTVVNGNGNGIDHLVVEEGGVLGMKGPGPGGKKNRKKKGSMSNKP